MKITVELSAIQTALDAVARIAPPSSGNITFSASKKVLYLISSAELSRCKIVVPCTVTGDEEFAVPAQALRDAIKGRKELELVFANEVLTVRAGQYSTKLNTVEVIPLDDIDKEETKNWKLTAEQGLWLKSALKTVNLKPTSMLSPWMPSGIQLTAKGAFVACYDTQHMNWLSSKEITGDFECVLPSETLSNIMEVCSKTDFQMDQAKSYIRVRNKRIDAHINIPSTDDIPPIAAVREKIREAGKETGDTFVVAKADVLEFMDNAKSIMTTERAELQVSTEKGIKLEIKTGQGSSKAILKGKGKGTFKVDCEYLRELIDKSPDEVVMNVVANSFISLKLKDGSALVAQNQ